MTKNGAWRLLRVGLALQLRQADEGRKKKKEERSIDLRLNEVE
jgi:hypothetical protein